MIKGLKCPGNELGDYGGVISMKCDLISGERPIREGEGEQ